MMVSKAKRHENLCLFLNSIYIQKNKDYGDSFKKTFDEFGMVSVLCRVTDKIERLKTLANEAPEVVDEPLRDTLLDLANYCLMAILELDSTENEEDENVEAEEDKMDEGDELEEDDDSTAFTDEDEIREELQEYTKNDLIKVLEKLQVTPPRKATKDELIDLIMAKPLDIITEVLDED